MADSNITKRALASTMKELMREMPFEKIKVTDICERCDMNRKSFYYHFRDKYDLVNWIFDNEFIAVVSRKNLDTGYDFLSFLCQHLYDNSDFYRKALKIQGQNSFSEHFREMFLPIQTEYMRQLFGKEDIDEFYINFFSDAFVSAIERWILDKNCVEPDSFVALLQSCVTQSAEKVHDRKSKN